MKVKIKLDTQKSIEFLLCQYFAHQLEIASENAKKSQNAELQSTAENSEQKNNTTDDGGVKYSIKQTKNIPYLEQIELIEKGELNGSNALYIGEPSESLLKIGFSNYPFAMHQGDYRKSRRRTAKNKKYSQHGVKRKFFEQLPQKLNEAEMFIDNGEKVTIITDEFMIDTKNNPSYIILGVDRNGQMDNEFVNHAKSVYPLDDFIEQVRGAAELGKLVIINKNKANDMLAPIGIQPSERSRIINLAKKSLSQVATDVNKKIKTLDIRYSRKMVNDVDSDKKKKYNKHSIRDSKNSMLMQWANSASVEVGELKIFSDRYGRFSLYEKTADGCIEIMRNTMYEDVKEEYDEANQKSKSTFYEHSNKIRADRDRGMRDSVESQNGKNVNRDAGPIGSEELQSDTTGSNEHLRTGDKSKSLKLSPNAKKILDENPELKQVFE